MTLFRTRLAAGCCLVALASAAQARPAVARDLAFALPDDPVLRAALRQAVLQPFATESGLAVDTPAWSGAVAELRDSAAAWDMVLADGAALSEACAAGLLEHLDAAKMLGRDRFVVSAPSDCAVPALAWGTVLAWNTEKFAGVPSWGDFWDVAKHPGKRGLLRGPRQTLEIALLADGVAPGDVYATLRSDGGVDRAFRKLDQLRPYVVWYDAAADAPGLIGSGAVLLTSADSRVVVQSNRAEHSSFGLQWTHSLLEVEGWAVVKGGVNIADAEHLLAYAADPARQAALVALVPWLPVTRPTTSKGDTPDAAPETPDLGTALTVDAQFWRENQAKLEQRFAAWLAKT
ncbi:MAG: extracellular solute-binding protein [Janthinobacterium lividum]